MSFKEIESNLKGVQETVQAGQNQLSSALEFLESARVTLQDVAGYSAVAEHAQAVGLFQDAEADLVALRARLEQFHPAVASYLGSLGMSAASDGETSPPPSPSSTEREKPPEKQPEEQPTENTPPADESGKKSGEQPAKPSVESTNVDDSGDTSSTEHPTSEPEEQVSVDRYRDMVNDIYSKPAVPMDEEPNYISEGGASYVLDAGDGNVVKVAKSSDEDYDYFDDYDKEDLEEGEEPPTPTPTEHETRVDTVKALQRGKGIEGVEQLVTYGSLDADVDEPLEDTDNLIIVTKKVPGTQLSDMGNDERAAIPEEHYEKFIDTLTAMRENNIIIDNDGDNIMYDPGTGFTAIDYSTVESRAPQFKPELSTVEDIATSFADPEAGTLVRQDSGETTIPEHAVKYHDVVQRKLGDEAAARVRERIQRRFGSQWPQA